MNTLLVDDDLQAERIQAWALSTLRAEHGLASAWDEETQYALPAVLPRVRVVPTAQLVSQAVARHLAESAELPKAVVMHPLRLLSLARYDAELYFCGAAIVALRTRGGLDVDEMYGVCPVVTQPVEIVIGDDA